MSTDSQPTSQPTACLDFAQHAWRPDICVNCQRPKAQHCDSKKPAKKASARIVIKQSAPQEAVVISGGETNSQPVASKRVSTLPRQNKSASQAKSHEGKQDAGPQNGQTDKDKNQVNSHHHENKDGSPKKQVGRRESSSPKRGQPRSIMSHRHSSDKEDRKIVDERRRSRVAFVDTSPQVIGQDGGMENFFPDDEDKDNPDDLSTDEASVSLTDEEKSFALLALENTMWNSHAENLLKDRDKERSGAPQRHSREFEDLSLDALSQSKHFHNLKDCDATKRFGTFPLRSSRSSSSKLPLDSVVFSSSHSSEFNSLSSSSQLANPDREDKRSEVSSTGSATVAPSSVVKLSTSVGDGGGSGGGGERLTTSSGAYRMVSIVDDKNLAYSVTDITSCLYDPSQPHCDPSSPHPSSKPPHHLPSDDSMSENSSSSRGQEVSSSEGNSPMHHVKVRGRSRPTAIRVSSMETTSSQCHDSSTEKGESSADMLNDSATAAGLQVLAFLNDVLDNYGENESSTDDQADTGKTSDKAKKCTDFEARMASVAANLDLSKQQRSKRPAPRPPSSPPPEPTAVSPKKKMQNQTEPIFKMVPVGKAILATPPMTHDLPRSSPGSSPGLPSLDDVGDVGEGERSNGDGGRAKKGITSFFKNILRRGKDSQDSFESSNTEVQFAVRSEVTSSSAPSLMTEGGGGGVEGRQRKGSDAASSAQGKVRVLPTGGIKGGSSSTGDLPKTAVRKSESDGGTGGEGGLGSGAGKGSSSPPTHSKGLSSPKQMLKRTAACISPPTQHKALPQQAKDEAPMPSPKSKPTLISRKSDEKDATETTTTTTAASQPTPVRRRTKSPKRVPPPAPPPSSAQPGKKAGGEEGGGSLGSASDLTRELEQKLKATGICGSTPALPSSTKPEAPVPMAKISWQMVKADSQSTTAAAAAMRADLRKSMTVPPPSPPTTKPGVARTPPASPTQEESDSQPGSPTDEMSNSDDSPRFMEKIELPTAAPGKKGILGKLNMNRKSRAPAPPAVKRARSTSDAEKRSTKRINPADISAPVLVTESTNTAALENRRNTISLGDDPAFSSAQSIEKGFDDLDMPILSPLGSLENLYEAILPKDPSATPDGKFPFYDPPDSNTRTLCPNVPAEGYLEPVANPAAAAAAAVAASSIEVLSSSTGDGDLKVGGSGAGSTLARSLSEADAGVRGSAGSGGKQAFGNLVAGEGENFVEPELTEERRVLIANQPIYEEIAPYGPPPRTHSHPHTSSVMDGHSQGSPARAAEPSLKGVISATLPHPKRSKPPSEVGGQRSRRSGSMSSHDAPAHHHHHHPPSALKTSTALNQPMTSSMTSALQVTSTSSSSSGSGVSAMSPFMTASMTSSLMWHTSAPQPVDSNGDFLPLPPLPSMAPRSLSKETVSSESDSQSSTLSRPPRPVPRRRPKRPDTTGSDQYVSMNRPNTQVTLGESKLRETYWRLTALHFQTLHDMYIQCERLLALDKMVQPTGATLKWADFDIYGQALHASGRCVVYNAKLRGSNTACQLMVLHSRPAAEMSQSAHPSLLRPTAIFADNVPFSFLTADFIKTSQLLQNSVYDSCMARCFLAVGVFDITESLSTHLTLIRETLTHDPGGYLRVLLMTTLQLLSALSHCLDRGFTVTETDLGDVFHITRPDLRGKVVAFLPHQRAPDVPQGEAMCVFLDRLLQEATNDYYHGDPTHQTSADPVPESDEEAHLLSTVERLRMLLEPRRLDCLAHVRAVVEYTMWGPGRGKGDHSGSSGESTPLEAMGEGEGLSSVEQDHSVWLERERAWTVARFACSMEGLGGGISLEDFYRLKFLLKSSATSLAECWRRMT